MELHAEAALKREGREEVVGGGGTQVTISGAAAQPVFPPVFCTRVET